MEVVGARWCLCSVEQRNWKGHVDVSQSLPGDQSRTVGFCRTSRLPRSAAKRRTVAFQVLPLIALAAKQETKQRNPEANFARGRVRRRRSSQMHRSDQPSMNTRQRFALGTRPQDLEARLAVLPTSLRKNSFSIMGSYCPKRSFEGCAGMFVLKRSTSCLIVVWMESLLS